MNISSAASTMGSPGEYVWYAASKGAIDSLTIGLAKELATHNIRVNAVQPGMVETEIHAISSGDPGRVERIRPMIPMQRIGKPEEIADAVMYLLSDKSSYVTGAMLAGLGRALIMLKVRIIPCLDVKDGRVVKGVNFVDLRDAGDPVEAAKAYDAAGADELCFLDITASHENRAIIFDVVSRTAEACFMPLDGRRRRARRPTTSANCCWPAPTRCRSIPPPCSIATFVGRAAEKFGSQCIVVAIDAKSRGAGALGDLHPWRAGARPGSMRSTLHARSWRWAPAKSS